jgi:hypothetical protein
VRHVGRQAILVCSSGNQILTLTKIIPSICLAFRWIEVAKAPNCAHLIASIAIESHP